MLLTTQEILFLGVWALIGSILGFFAFTNTPELRPLLRLYKCCLSVGIGLFISFPICIYLQEIQMFSKSTNIMFSGLGAFGLPDFLLKYWPRLMHNVVDKVLDKVGGDRHHHRPRPRPRYEKYEGEPDE